MIENVEVMIEYAFKIKAKCEKSKEKKERNKLKENWETKKYYEIALQEALKQNEFVKKALIATKDSSLHFVQKENNLEVDNFWGRLLMKY